MNQVHAEGGRAEIGVGFFLAIFAFGASLFAIGAVIFGLMFGLGSVKDDNIRLEGQINDLKIQLEELKGK